MKHASALYFLRLRLLEADGMTRDDAKQIADAEFKEKESQDRQNDHSLKRSNLAAFALLEYLNRSGTYADDAIVDLLSDLHHVADRFGLDIDEKWEKAQSCYKEESFFAASDFAQLSAE